MSNKLENIKKFWDEILSHSSEKSSKRFLAVYVVIVLGTLITVWALKNNVDYIYLLGTWLAFAASLLGLSEYNKNRTAKHNASVEIEKAKSNQSKEPKLTPDNEIN